MNKPGLQFLICLFLVLATLTVFLQVKGHDFVNYDDYRYVTENPHVRSGWTLEGARWAFKSTFHGHWHPLTWLSHMTDVQVFGLNPAGHHLVNLLFHLANTLLLFLVLKRMTGDLLRSALVAALFALHPLHVEPVAWVAGRKDLLSAFFWMWALLAYSWYCRGPGFLRYFLVIFLFGLGLAAKSMVVTLPLVLLLLDYWPMKRLRLGQSEAEQGGEFKQEKERTLLRPITEKAIPLAVLALSAAFTLLVMKTETQTAFTFSKLLPEDLGRVPLHYALYIWKMFRPVGLAVPYPHLELAEPWKAAAGLFLLGVSFAVVWKGRRHPYLLTGWMWYLITLLPVVGLVRIGPQSMADRYTYIPLIGLFIMIVWGVEELSRTWRFRPLLLAAASAATLSSLAILSFVQTSHWKDSITLFSHTIRVIPNSPIAHNNLALALERQGKIDEAIQYYARSVQIKPGQEKAHNNLGIALARSGRVKEAVPHFNEALRIKPDFAYAHYNLGLAMARLGRLPEAVGHFKRSLDLAPGNPETHNNLGIALARSGRLEEAVEHFSEALRLNPNHQNARRNLDRTRKALDGASWEKDPAMEP